MGQKTNPISLRVHVNRNFESCWYQDTKYSNLLKKELEIRQYIHSLFSFMNVYQGRTLFQYFPKKLVIYSFITNKGFISKKNQNFPTNRKLFNKSQHTCVHSSIIKSQNKNVNSSTKQKGLLFLMQYILDSKQSDTVEILKLHSQLFPFFFLKKNCIDDSASRLHDHKKNLKGSLTQYTSQINAWKKTSDVSLTNIQKPVFGRSPLRFFYENVFTSLKQSTLCTTEVHPLKLHSKYQSASFLAQYIAECIEKQLSFRQIYRQIQKEIAQDKHILGFKFQCSGRLNGAEIAKVESKKLGQTSLHTLSASVDFAKSEAYTLYGIIGIKVWISCRF